MEAGAFEGERLELFRGRLVSKSPQKAAHAQAVETLNALLTPILAGRARVRIQSPFLAAGDSEPEPDVLLAPRREHGEHPSEAYLVIEVADSSLAYDRFEKGPLYAESGVPFYWIVNLVDRVVEVYSKPLHGRYSELRTVDRDAALPLPAPFDDVTLRIADFLA